MLGIIVLAADASWSVGDHAKIRFGSGPLYREESLIDETKRRAQYEVGDMK